MIVKTPSASTSPNKYIVSAKLSYNDASTTHSPTPSHTTNKTLLPKSKSIPGTPAVLSISEPQLFNVLSHDNQQGNDNNGNNMNLIIDVPESENNIVYIQHNVDNASAHSASPNPSDDDVGKM